MHRARPRAAPGSRRARRRALRSERMRMLTPAASASSASRQMRSSASSSPAACSLDRPGDVDRVRREDVGVDLAQASRARGRAGSAGRSRAGGRARATRRAGCARSRRSSRRSSRPPRGRVDRRVRHLREELLEVGVEERRAGRRAPRARGRCPSSRSAPRAFARQRREDHLQVLLRVAEGELARAQRLDRETRGGRSGRSPRWTTPRANHSP